ncbi:unnamed protein product, partial [Rotaria socialis]
MSSNPIINQTTSEPNTVVVSDETVKQNIEIVQPPEILSSKQSSNSDSYET